MTVDARHSGNSTAEEIRRRQYRAGGKTLAATCEVTIGSVPASRKCGRNLRIDRSAPLECVSVVGTAIDGAAICAQFPQKTRKLNVQARSH